MKIITKEIAKKLDANCGKPNQVPVLKLFTPWAGATWLVTERDSDDPDMLFGLADLGQGYPEIGYFRLSEIMSLKGPFGLRVERDRHWKGDKTITAYAAESSAAGRICA